LDVSGSMSGQKLDALKGAMNFVIQELAEVDCLAIVAFNSAATTVLQPTPMTPEGQGAAQAAAEALKAGGGTTISEGLSEGLQRMEEMRQERGGSEVCALLLLTDGQDGAFYQDMEKLVQRGKGIPCSLNAFGFGQDHDSQLLHKFALKAGRPFSYVKDPADMRGAFASLCGGLSSTVMENVEVQLETDCELLGIRTGFEWRRNAENPCQYSVTIPDMFAEDRRDILVELRVPASAPSGKEGVLLLKTSMTSMGHMLSEPMMVSARRSDQTPVETAEVRVQLERLDLSELLEKASKLADEKKFEEAKDLLSRARQEKRNPKLWKNAWCYKEVLDLFDGELERASHFMGSWNIGRPKVLEAALMHLMQRCANGTSADDAEAKTKSLYLNTAQQEWILRSSHVSPLL